MRVGEARYSQKNLAKLVFRGVRSMAEIPILISGSHT